MNVANANVANAPLREAKVEPKACINRRCVGREKLTNKSYYIIILLLIGVMRDECMANCDRT